MMNTTTPSLPNGYAPQPVSESDTESGPSRASMIALIAVVLAALAGLLIFVFTRGTDSAASTAPTPIAALVDASPTSGPDTLFASALGKHEFTGPARQLSGADRIGIARSVCADLRSGDSWYSEISTMVNSGMFNGADAGYFVGVSVSVYCPDLVNLLPSN